MFSHPWHYRLFRLYFIAKHNCTSSSFSCWDKFWIAENWHTFIHMHNSWICPAYMKWHTFIHMHHSWICPAYVTPKIWKSKPRNLINNLNLPIYYIVLSAKKDGKLKGILCLGACFASRGGDHILCLLVCLKPQWQLSETVKSRVYLPGGYRTLSGSVCASQIWVTEKGFSN